MCGAGAQVWALGQEFLVGAAAARRSGALGGGSNRGNPASGRTPLHNVSTLALLPPGGRTPGFSASTGPVRTAPRELPRGLEEAGNA